MSRFNLGANYISISTYGQAFFFIIILWYLKKCPTPEKRQYTDITISSQLKF